MDADGSNPMQLTGDAFNDYWPAWSPDGARITFTSDRYGDPEIMAMNADGSHQANLSHRPGADSGPAWRPGNLPPLNTHGPRISALEPAVAATSGGSLVTISGAGLEEGSRVAIGGVEATVLEFLDSHTITVAAPQHRAGVVDVVITNSDGRSGTLPGGFTYHPPIFTDVAQEAGVLRFSTSGTRWIGFRWGRVSSFLISTTMAGRTSTLRPNPPGASRRTRSTEPTRCTGTTATDRSPTSPRMPGSTS